MLISSSSVDVVHIHCYKTPHWLLAATLNVQYVQGDRVKSSPRPFSYVLYSVRSPVRTVKIAPSYTSYSGGGWGEEKVRSLIVAGCSMEYTGNYLMCDGKQGKISQRDRKQGKIAPV